MEIVAKGQEELNKEVREAGLCTGCGACVNLCPYHVVSQDQIVKLHACDIKTGRCYAFCPRTPTDLSFLREQLFVSEDLIPELGSVKGYFITRAADAKIRKHAQHGGTVTALLDLALKARLIDTAIVAEEGKDICMTGHTLKNRNEIKKRGGSRFTVAPMVAEFNRALEKETGGIGIVATPCQCLALAKMRLSPPTVKNQPMDRLKLVIGLFCGWTVSQEAFASLLSKKGVLQDVTGMDITPGKQVVEIKTLKGNVDIPMEEIEGCIREACRFCFDTTSEFSDLSVGSARLPGSWAETRTWNQLIVRTSQGMDLLELAKKKGVLEFHDFSEDVFTALKNAALTKKKAALERITAKSGSREDLLYLGIDDPLVNAIFNMIHN